MYRQPNNFNEFMDDPFNMAYDPFFSNNFRDVYNNVNMNNNIAQNKPQQPSIVNFDLANNPARKVQEQKQTEDAKKYGIKTLLNSKTKFSYPFENKDDPAPVVRTMPANSVIVENKKPNVQVAPKMSTSVSNKPNIIPQMDPRKPASVNIPINTYREPVAVKTNKEKPAKNTIDDMIKDAHLQKKDDFVIKTENIPVLSKPITQSNDTLVVTSTNTIEKPTENNDKEINLETINKSDIKENLSDLQSILMPKDKKIDNKKDDNTIVKTANKVETNTPMEKLPENIPAPPPVPAPEAPVVEPVVNVVNKEEDAKKQEAKPENKKPEWPSLTIDDINTSFKVVADLREGIKLKIVNHTHLAEDTSYLPSVTRYLGNQERDHIISFLNHLYDETKRNVDIVLKNIRSNIDVDNNVYVLQGIVGKIFGFLHKYETMRNVYKSDSSAFARLGNNKEKFYTYIHTLFRDMTVPK